MPRLTGERPLRGATPDSLLAFHAAGYREIGKRLGSGTVLDVGCGVGTGTQELAAPDRLLVGIDYSAQTAIDAAHDVGGDGVRFAAMDGARLGARDRSIDFVCSSHIIEHFTSPIRHVAELARVATVDGTAFVITPNRPADFENPFHVYTFVADELTSMLRLFFDDVEIHGLEGSPELHADFAKRRASGEKLVKLDPFRLRQKVPRSWYVYGYTRLLPIVYRALGPETTGIGSGIDASHFFLSDTITPETPGLFAIARAPRR
ncbi:MAG: class I SAM-dependent methyltransferase [Acidimicrobiia bacterium]